MDPDGSTTAADLAVIASVNPAQAWSHIRELLAGPDRGKALTNLPWQELGPLLAGHDPGGAIDLGLELPTGQAAHVLCVEGFRRLAAVNGPEAWTRLAALGPGQLYADSVTALLEAWATTSPAAAAQAALSVNDLPPGALSALSGVWGSRDFADAFTWAGHLPEAQRMDCLIEAVRATLNTAASAENLPAVTERLTGIEDAAARQQLLKVAAMEVSLASPSTAMEWAAMLPAVERAAIEWEVISHISSLNIELAAEHAASMIKEEETSEAARQGIATVAKYYAAQDAASAAEWCHRLPAGSIRLEAAQTALETWVQQDAASASGWVANLPKGDMRRMGAQLIAEAVASSDQDAALAWQAEADPTAE